MAATTYSVLNTNDSGAGSLRQAILDANANAGTDTIMFDASLSGQTIVLTSGELTISDAISINGLGADSLTISGNNTSRIFYVSDNTNTEIDVTIGGLTLTNGMLSGDNDGAAIWSLENLTISNSTLTGNTTNDDGGAIRNDGTLLVQNSTLSNNVSIGTSDTSGGGAIINTTGSVATIENSTISGNQAKNGGGIRNDGTLTVINSTLSGNSAVLSGGGISNTVGNSTITNSTITNNTAVNGGGVFNFEGVIPVAPGINIPVTTTSTVTSSIIAGNVGNNDLGGGDGTTSGGDFISGGNNLIGNGDGAAGFTNGVNGDIVGTTANPVDPLLGALADNGGFTQTHALLTGSPAIDVGSNPNSVTTDQRGSGFLRSQGAGIDIGAFEIQQSSSYITDFNNDNLPDIVWRNGSQGRTSIWYTDGQTKLSQGATSHSPSSPNWVTVGVGDYDQDGERDDILWHNQSTNSNVVWFMNGRDRVGRVRLDNSQPNSNWEVEGVGDFDHSGYADDILWRNTATGKTVVWRMDGTTKKPGRVDFGVINSVWQAHGVGDFDDNGYLDDIVLRNSQNSTIKIWTNDGATRNGSYKLENSLSTTAWRIEGVGDFDGDGVVNDLFWYNSSKELARSWSIENGVKVSTSSLNAVPPGSGWDAVI